jgi:hypothetical protein
MAENAKHQYENKCGTLLSLIVFGIWLFSCLCVQGQPQTIKDPSHINIYVTPWYNSEGPAINIGKFSSGLASTNDAVFVATIREMKRAWQKLSFTEMYVATIRLYDQGYRKESVYWFYSAQYRDRLFNALLDEKKVGGVGDPGFELSHAGGAFYELAGPYINGYGFGDVDSVSRIIQRVQKESEQLPKIKTTYPGVIFKNESEWPRQNREIGNGLGELLSMIKEQKSELKQQRAKNGIEAQFAKLTSREFPDYSEKDTASIDRLLSKLQHDDETGKPDAATQDREALVKLGCFEHTDFPLKSRSLTMDGANEFEQLVTNSVFVNYNYAVVLNMQTNAQAIGVTAHRADIPTWGKLVTQFDSAKVK